MSVYDPPSDLPSNEDYLKKTNCPACDSNNINVGEADQDWSPYNVYINCDCAVCKAKWKEVYTFSRYEMVGTK
jgi:hypothetical protein